MPAFIQLADPRGYLPCPTEDMLTDIPYRDYWLNFFPRHFKKVIVKLALDTYGKRKARDIQACCDDLSREFRALKKKPALYGELNLLVLDLIRQQRLHSYCIPDPFQKLKARENQAMLKLYPKLIAELDVHTSASEELLLLVEGVFAGNIFDLGAGATAELYSVDSPDFIQVRDGLGGKPWLYDHFDAFAKRALRKPGYKKVILFIDNAGSDCILGVLPLTRWLANRGTTVVLAANRLPALNDMTFRETTDICTRVAALDPLFAKLFKRRRIRVIDSGGVAPLIDLRHVSDICNKEAADADLVILEGMGRGLESNFDARFKCDAVKLCMIKEQIVADRHGGKLFDVVFRFDRAGKRSRRG
jgi:type II pantothenate kinase